MTPAIADKHIVIAGAGLAGLAFAHAIERFWPEDQPKPSITIYERGTRDVAPEREGYSIGLRSDRDLGGLQVLQKLGMLQDLLPKSLSGLSGSPGSMTIWNTAWKPLFRRGTSNEPPDGLPISHTRFFRPTLRQHFIDHLPSTVEVHWSTQCVSMSRHKDDKLEVLLDNGTTTHCDLLVAADGANSKMRASILPEDTLSYAGAVFIMGQSKFSSGVPSVIKNSWGLVLGAGTSAFVSPINHDTAVWSISYRSSEPRQKTSSFQDSLEDKRSLLSEARRRGKAYAEPFQQLLDNSNLESIRVLNAMDKQPIQNHKLDMPVVFIGDSSHAVSPFAGAGANMALLDGLDLAMELCTAADLSEAIKRFDKKSSPRAKKSVTSSHFAIRMAHSTGWRLTLWVLLLRFMMFISRK